MPSPWEDAVFITLKWKSQIIKDEFFLARNGAREDFYTTEMHLDHKSSGVPQQRECERGYELSGADCAQGITPSCLFDNRSDLELKNRIWQQKLSKQIWPYSGEETAFKDNRWRKNTKKHVNGNLE